MTRAQRGLDEGWPDEPQPGYGRNDGWGTDTRGYEDRGYDNRSHGDRAYDGRGIDGRGIDGRDGWGSDVRVPERRAEPPARPRGRGESPLSQSQPQAPVPAAVANALPPINPYAVVALVAALLLLFPIAIVFGFIAFSYRGGRGLAISALLIGVLEALAVIGVLVAIPNLMTNGVTIGSLGSTVHALGSTYLGSSPTWQPWGAS